MRLIFLSFVFLLASTSLTAQQLPEWYRVYTFDESVIDMNTSIVSFITKDIARVRFRWTFDQPEVLRENPLISYKSRLEVMEFNCSEHRYRPYHLTFFDFAGNILRIEEMHPPREWSSVSSSRMMAKLYEPACELIKKKTSPPIASSDAIELEKVAKYALAFSRSLEKAKDFKPIIEKYFAANYLNGYLHDNNTNWFLNLNRDIAAKVSRAELERFYVASLNAGYVSCLYLISQSLFHSDEAVPDENLVPTDIAQLIKDHPYTQVYRHNTGNYDFLAENIDSVERLRSYTDLLEKIGALMRNHATAIRAEESKEYLEMLEDWDWKFDLYQPKVLTCPEHCLGFPKGTKLFEVNVPVFRLQLAEIRGQLKVVSIIDSFR